MRGSAGMPAELDGLRLDPGLLGPTVARALGVPVARVTRWRAQRLRAGAGNPTSAGVHRVAGEAQVDGLSRRWSMVLKALQSPASVGRPDFGDEIDHWNYWLRELRAFETGLLAQLPGAVRAPAYFGYVETEERAWLWLEDMGDLARSDWTVEACSRAAHHLGLFEGAYLAGRPLPAARWLGRGMLRQWAGLSELYAPGLAMILSGDEPLARLAAVVGGDGLRNLVACLARPAELLDALDRLPHTLSHQDANADNLLLQRDAAGNSQLLALDWQLMGLSPAGAAVGELLNSLDGTLGPPAWAREKEVLEAYCAGLGEAGASVSKPDVELAYVASSVLRQGIFMFIMLRQEVEAAAASGDGSPVEIAARFVDQNERMLVRLASMAGRARTPAAGHG